MECSYLVLVEKIQELHKNVDPELRSADNVRMPIGCRLVNTLEIADQRHSDSVKTHRVCDNIMAVGSCCKK